MENIFVEFLPPWIETGLQPAFYDKESGTVLQQTARMYARVNMLIRMFNKLSKNTKTTVEDYINQFNELHDYVHDYFDNLDVQEEINNKLDEMVENGDLEEIINDYLYTFGVPYEKFGAVGDGVTDDYAAIKATHEYANTNGIPVVCNPNKTYYVHGITHTIEIATNVNWNGCHFIIDDSGTIDNNFLFKVKGNTPVDITSSIDSSIATTTTVTNVTGYGRAILKLVNSNKRDYIRSGANADNGVARTEYIMISDNGNVLSRIDFPFSTITEAKVKPIESTTLTLENGNFETKINTIDSTNYYNRGIYIERSNVDIKNLVHTLDEEGVTDSSPYVGFFYTDFCADIRFIDCKVSGHKSFSSTGSYDITNNATLNLTFDNVVQINSITDNRIWGVHGSNYCKNVTFNKCYLNGIDGHKGMTDLTIQNCTVGRSISLVGFGNLIIKNTTGLNFYFINLREDYGSFWNGDLYIKNCHLKTNTGGNKHILYFNNKQDHDYGYETHLPNIHINGFYFDNGSYTNSICKLMTNNADASITTPDFTKTYAENAASGVYPIVYPKHITLINVKTNNYFIPTNNVVDFQNCYFGDLGSAEVVGVRSRGFDKNYNYYLKIDNCNISTLALVNSYANTNNSVFRKGGVQGIAGTPSHHGVGRVEIDNCDYVELGNSGRMVTYYLNNCSVYMTSSGYTYNYGCFVMDNCKLHMHYNGNSTNARFTFGTYSTKITNSEYIIDDETFSNIANKEYIFLVRSVSGGHSSVRYISINNEFNLEDSDYNTITVFNSNKANYLWDIEKFITTPVFETENIKVSTSAKRPDYNLMAGVSYYDTGTSAIVSYNGNSWS